jgi:hypothetical protein
MAFRTMARHNRGAVSNPHSSQVKFARRPSQTERPTCASEYFKVSTSVLLQTVGLIEEFHLCHVRAQSSCSSNPSVNSTLRWRTCSAQQKEGGEVGSLHDCPTILLVVVVCVTLFEGYEYRSARNPTV